MPSFSILFLSAFSLVVFTQAGHGLGAPLIPDEVKAKYAERILTRVLQNEGLALIPGSTDIYGSNHPLAGGLNLVGNVIGVASGKGSKAIEIEVVEFTAQSSEQKNFRGHVYLISMPESSGPFRAKSGVPCHAIMDFEGAQKKQVRLRMVDRFYSHGALYLCDGSANDDLHLQLLTEQ